MSETIEIKVPDIGDFEGVPVIEVLVEAGDRVEQEQSLITLESDKATMEVPSPATGTVREVKVSLGDSVSEGHVVAVLETDGADAGGEAEPASDEPGDNAEQGQGDRGDAAAGDAPSSDDEVAAGAAQDDEDAAQGDAGPAATDDGAAPDAGPRRSPPVPLDADRVMPERVPYASPVIRQFARELGVDLGLVEGSGRKGRILREDVSAFVKRSLAAPASGAPAQAAAGGGFPYAIAPPPKVDFAKFGEVDRQELSRIQKLSGANLHRNWVGIPHVTQHDAADITDMEEFRQANKDDAAAQGFKLTPVVFLIKASVAALKKYPQFNASLDPDGEHLVLKKYFHIGIAVDTPNGLVVPVIRDCERKGIMELAEELGEISERARAGKLSPTEMQGGCFSISSLGGIGGTAFTPIINAPEVAILGVSRSRMEPVWNGEAFEPRLMLPLSLSYDHRVIDGAAAARFTRYLGERLEDLRRLTL